MGRRGLDSSGLGKADAGECGSEPSDSGKCGEFLDNVMISC